MLQTLSVDIRECYLLAEQCRRLAETAVTPYAKTELRFAGPPVRFAGPLATRERRSRPCIKRARS